MDGRKAQLDIKKHEGGMIMLVIVLVRSVNYGRIKHLWEDIIKHGVSAATTEYCEWI